MGQARAGPSTLTKPDNLCLRCHVTPACPPTELNNPTDCHVTPVCPPTKLNDPNNCHVTAGSRPFTPFPAHFAPIPAHSCPFLPIRARSHLFMPIPPQSCPFLLNCVHSHRFVSVPADGPISTPDLESSSETTCFKQLPEALDLPLDQRERVSVLEVDLEERTHVDEIAKGVSSEEEAGPAVDAGLTLGTGAATTPEWNES